MGTFTTWRLKTTPFDKAKASSDPRCIVSTGRIDQMLLNEYLKTLTQMPCPLAAVTAHIVCC